ncbi:Rod shape-determining protein RodA [gamma proteobacterium HTCC5015]|nr:Rod shape-determining protein RodA [gamma proteobacterium HTCC5015]
MAPAGVEKANTGHHHLLVDFESLPPLDRPLGADVKHFGGGQTETTIDLKPGEHTLQLILGDHLHIPHNPAVVSEKITITVEEKEEASE